MTSKYHCKENLDKLSKYIDCIKNRNIKFDYNKIYKNLETQLENLEKELKHPTQKTYDLYLLNYMIENYIININN